jgi:hypothetical protein
MAWEPSPRTAAALSIAILAVVLAGVLEIARRVEPGRQALSQLPANGRPQEACQSRTTGDFDGDGSRDWATVYSTGPGCAARPQGLFWVRLDLSRGDTILRRLKECDSACRAYGAPDFDDNGRDELLIRITAGASTETLRVFYVNGTGFTRAGRIPPFIPGVWEFGPGVDFVIGSGVTHHDWFDCRDDQGGGRVVVQYTADNLEEPRDHFTVREVVTRFVNEAAFEYLGQREYRIAMDDPRAFELGGSGNEEVCGTRLGATTRGG